MLRLHDFNFWIWCWFQEMDMNTYVSISLLFDCALLTNMQCVIVALIIQIVQLFNDPPVCSWRCYWLANGICKAWDKAGGDQNQNLVSWCIRCLGLSILTSSILLWPSQDDWWSSITQVGFPRGVEWKSPILIMAGVIARQL